MEYDENLQGTFCKYCKKLAKASNKTGGTWITKAFINWKKALAKTTKYAESKGVHASHKPTQIH